MMKEINILFLGGSKRISIAEKFIEAGLSLNYKINIFSYELTDKNPIFFIAKEVIIGKKWNEASIYNHIEEVIQTKEIHILIPFVDPATIILSKLKNQIQEKYPKVLFAVSDFLQTELFFNKLTANSWCLLNEINVPDQVLDHFPLIAKPKAGSASKGIIIVENVEQLVKIDQRAFLIQKFINGFEYTIDCYVSYEHKVISITPRSRIEVQGGESIISKTFKEKDIINFSERILKKACLFGAITIQIIIDKSTSEIFFMELNPRFGGGVVTSIGAGANIPLYLLNDYLGIKQEYTENWNDKVLMIRRFNEFFIQCK